MSYVLNSDDNKVFTLRELINAPLLQSQLVCKLDSLGKVHAVMTYVGTVVSSDENPPQDNDPAKGFIAAQTNYQAHPGSVQQCAAFHVIDTLDPNIQTGNPSDRYDRYLIPLTETTLDHALFAFIPVKYDIPKFDEDKPAEAPAQEE